MVDSVLFITGVIIGATQIIKYLAPGVRGVITFIVAMAVGALVSLFSTPLGLDHISVALGILTGLAAGGFHTVASATASGTDTSLKS